MIVIMTIYRPYLQTNGEPRYIALADAIARDIEAGVLAPGDQLPTHRDLATRLGVSIGTVTRGYAEAERRGLISGEVGRGTFVRAADPADGWGGAGRESGVIDLSLALPWTLGEEEGRLLAETLQAVTREADMVELLQYQPGSATPRHRMQAASWLVQGGVPAQPETVVLTAGAQHALTVVLATFLRPGDTLAVEELTYPGVKALAQMLGLRLRGIALDGEGLVPESLDRICREGPVRALYCVPTAQNPTSVTMSEERRRRIIEVAQAHDLLVIEDDVHGMLVDTERTPLAAMAPERTVHIATVSKALAFGLRTALVAMPETMVDRMLVGVRSTMWMVPPLMVDVTLRWLNDEHALALARRKREEMAERQALVEAMLGSRCTVTSAPGAIHAWVQLPEPWRSDELVAHARQRDVLVAGAEAFLVGRGPVPHAVRLAVGTVRDRAELRSALQVLDDVLAGATSPLASIV